MKLRFFAVLERTIDAVVLGFWVVVAIQTDSEFIRIAAVVAVVLLLIGRYAAWYRGRFVR